MKTINLVYPDFLNAGDVFSPQIVGLLSGLPVARSKAYNADMLALGGALFTIQYSPDFKKRCLQKALRLVYGKKPLYVWGSGFFYHTNTRPFYRDNLIVCALRGQKTRQKLFELTGKWYDVPLADPGLLVDMVGGQNPEKRHEIGLIAHITQQNDPVIKAMAADPRFHWIDIRRSPREVADEIASCRCIASSSLHGLIFADALHVPSLHILGEKQTPGGSFKFEDYYSSFGLEDTPWLPQNGLPTAQDILDRYKISPEAVEEKKRQLRESFPRF